MDVAILIVTIIACIFAGISASPFFLKFFLYMKEKLKRRKYCFRIYDINSPSTAKRIKELVDQPENIKYASLTCPKFDSVLKINDPIIKDYKKYYGEEVHENFRYVLSFLTQDGVHNNFLLKGLNFDDVVEIVRNYMKRVMYTKKQSDSEKQVDIDIYKYIINQEGKRQRVSFRVVIDKSKKTEEQWQKMRTLMADSSFFNRDDLVESLYPAMLLTIGNLKEFALDDAAKVLFISDYNFGPA